MGKYATPKAYRTALESRIVADYKKSGEDISRLRKKAAFDSALTRLYAGDHGFVLKGGYALELRLETSRATKDLDFVTKRLLRATLASAKEDLPEALRTTIELSLSTKTGSDDDYFNFIIGEPMAELVGGGGGYRYPVEARVDGRKFEAFHIDVSIGDFVTESNDRIKRASKARIPSDQSAEYEAEIITKEQHFAEKIHAYTLPRDGINSRAKDLVDMVLLINAGLDGKKVENMISEVFEHRGTHQPPTTLGPPPGSWAAAYTKLATECKVAQTITEAYDGVRRFYEKLRF